METNLERQVLDMQSKKNKGTILVSGASGIVGYGILRSLRNSGYRLIGTTIYEISPADCFSDVVLRPPKTVDENYITWLIETINEYSIDMIIPGIEDDMSVWNKNRSVIEKTGTFVMLNDSFLVELCLDKWFFFEKLKSCKLPCVIETSLDCTYEKYARPFILKPRCGFGSKGIVKIDSEDEFEKYRGKIGPELMMQEYVGTEDEEYTMSAFFDVENKLQAYIIMKRKLSKLGFTEFAEVVEIPELVKIICEISDVLKPIGPTNFQFRKHNNEWKILEINPRISSSTSIRTKMGYNECQMCVDYFLEHKSIEQPHIRKGKAYRYTEDYIIYDCDNI